MIIIWFKKLICKLINHWMVLDGADVTGPSHCKICGHKKDNKIEWPKYKGESE